MPHTFPALRLPRRAALVTSLLTLALCSSPIFVRADSVVAPFPASPDYVAEGVVYGMKAGSERAAFTARYTGTPTNTTRPISMERDSALNAELVAAYSASLGPRPLPPVYGGFDAAVYAMKEPAPYTARVQFQNGSAGRNDFINLHVYVEDKRPQPPGLEFGFTGVFLFPAGEAGAPRVVPLDKITVATFLIASQRATPRLARVIVRDADGGGFYVSDAYATENQAAIPLAGGKWAKINPSDLAVSGEYGAAPFKRVDHIGVYATIPVTTISSQLPAFGVICNVALHSFEYTLSP